MLSMHTSSFFTHPDLNDSEIREGESRESEIPAIPCSGIRGSFVRASTSSASTGASTDDASADSLDWNEKSPSVELDQDQQQRRVHFESMQLLEDIMEVPKVEEIEDELSSIKQDVESTGPVPRKRGRPRKHPLPAPGGQAKITKGRSKTGCITCRRRKKKCDETKPA
jgi:hypothetical protein